MDSRYRGQWHHGWSYSAGDIVICNSAYYQAKSDRPCYEEPPDINDGWEWLHADYQSQNDTTKKC